MLAKNPYVVAIFVPVIYTGLYVISKAAIDNGLNTFVFIFYRQTAASIFLIPIAFVFGRKSLPPLKFMVLIKVFLHTLVGITLSLNVYNVGLEYSTATVASATVNSVPVLTFFFAVLFRMETVKLNSLPGIAKSLGVACCLAGILIIAFYKGPKLDPLNHNNNIFSQNTKCNSCMTEISRATWIKGSFLLICGTIAWSLWLVLQGMLLQHYPSKLLLTTLETVFSTVQSFFVAIAFERNISKWKLHLDTGLLAIVYCGFVVTGVSFYLQTWCIEKKGPVFLSMFTPLGLIFTMICSTLFLGEVVHLGSIFGGILMVAGLYSVLWGKTKEDIIIAPQDSKECDDQQVDNEKEIEV